MEFEINLGTIITSAITSIVFTGGTNYFLQKTNRKGNEIIQKGFILIDEIYSINEKRNEVWPSIIVYDNFPVEDLYKLYNDYLRSLAKFEITVKKYSILFDKGTNDSLQQFIGYLKEIKNGLSNYINNKSVVITVNNQKMNQLYETIIEQIQKQI